MIFPALILLVNFVREFSRVSTREGGIPATSQTRRGCDRLMFWRNRVAVEEFFSFASQGSRSGNHGL